MKSIEESFFFPFWKLLNLRPIDLYIFLPISIVLNVIFKIKYIALSFQEVNYNKMAEPASLNL